MKYSRRVAVIDIKVHICDAIKLIESFARQNQNSVFKFILFAKIPSQLELWFQRCGHLKVHVLIFENGIHMKKHHPNSYNSKFHQNRSTCFDMRSVSVYYNSLYLTV